MLTAIIVDDEVRNRNTLKNLLNEYCLGVSILEEADDVLSGVKAIQTHQPDVVFLDIEMPQYSGFKLVEYFDDVQFQIVFTTAYEQYALQAFGSAATGYLLKPIDIDELINVVTRVKQIKAKKSNTTNSTRTQYSKIDPNKKIDLPTKNGLIYLTINEILYLQAEGRNTHIFLKDGQQVLTTMNMKECQKIFFKTTLLRIHKSYMINIAYIEKHIKKLDAFVEMEGGKRLDVGQAFKEQLNKGLSFFKR